MRRLLVTIALVVPALLAGCGGVGSAPGSDPSGPPATGPASGATAATGAADPSEQSEPSGSPPAGAAACELLGPAEVTELAGRALGAGRPTTAGGSGTLPVCVWGSLSHVGIQVGAMPADLWADGLPEAVEQLEASGLADDPENTRKLAAAADLVASGETVAPGRACKLFSALLEATGAGKGQERSLNVVPTQAQPRGITGQTCRAGTYVTVLVARPDLSAESVEPLARKVEAARERVLSRSVR